MIWSSVLFEVFMYLWTTFCSVRKTPEWPLCVFIDTYIIYCGVGVIWQPSYSMCDVMFVRWSTNVLEELVYRTTWNHFQTDYNFKHFCVATSGATRYSEATFCGKQIYFCSLCLPYVYSNIQLFRRKHPKTQHCNLLFYCLLAIIFILNFWKSWYKKLSYVLRKRYLWHC
jgi:hypothetical protein